MACLGLDSFHSGLVFSAILHAAVAGVMCVIGSETDLNRKASAPEVIYISLVSFDRHTEDPAPPLAQPEPEPAVPTQPAHITTIKKIDKKAVSQPVKEIVPSLSNKTEALSQSENESDAMSAETALAESAVAKVSSRGIAGGAGLNGTQAGGNYESLVVSQLARVKRYPERAQRRGQEGSAVLRLAIDRRGELMLYEVASSSNNSLLDAEVLRMAKSAAPFPPPPSNYAGSRIEFLVPIQFKLQDVG